MVGKLSLMFSSYSIEWLEMDYRRIGMVLVGVGQYAEKKRVCMRGVRSLASHFLVQISKW